jgi:hypothetical protein
VIPIGAKPHYTEIHKMRRFCNRRADQKARKFIDMDNKAWRNLLYERNRQGLQ